jgi:hypothetical protein
MKRQAIEEFQPDQIQEVFNMAGGIVRKKSEFNIPQRCGDYGLRVFLLKLERWWCRHGQALYQGLAKVINPLRYFEKKW